MNATGCPYLMVTDQAFQPGVPGACDTSIVGFYLYTMINAGLTFITAVKQYSNWTKRSQHKSKIPRGPINQFMLSFFQFTVAALIGVNVINYHNGFIFSLISLMFLNFAYGYSLGLIRLVNLGEKIIPKNKRPLGDASAKLRTFDVTGKFLLTFQIFAIVSSSTVLIILSPVLTDKEDLISRLGWGLKALYATLTQFGYWYQFERCIRAIKSIQGNTAGIRAGDVEKRIRAMEFDGAIWKMRKNQLVHFAATPAALILALVAADAIPANIYLMYSSVLAQSIGGLIFEFYVKAKTGNRATEKSSSNNKPNQIVNSNNAVVVHSPSDMVASAVMNSNGAESRL